MKGWRECAADIFAKHGEIAAKTKSASGLGPSDLFFDEARGTRRTPENLGVYIWGAHRCTPKRLSPLHLRASQVYT